MVRRRRRGRTQAKRAGRRAVVVRAARAACRGKAALGPGSGNATHTPAAWLGRRKRLQWPPAIQAAAERAKAPAAGARRAPPRDAGCAASPLLQLRPARRRCRSVEPLSNAGASQDATSETVQKTTLCACRRSRRRRRRRRRSLIIRALTPTEQDVRLGQGEAAARRAAQRSGWGRWWCAKLGWGGAGLGCAGLGARAAGGNGPGRARGGAAMGGAPGGRWWRRAAADEP